ncbi:MAG: hypothetical protein U0R24_10125 [Solirubrobacterales bacterium]
MLIAAEEARGGAFSHPRQTSCFAAIDGIFIAHLENPHTDFPRVSKLIEASLG